LRHDLASTMVAPLREAAVIEDGDVTRTGEAEPVEVLEPPLHGHHVVAPLQYRNPERYEVLGEHGRGGIGRVQRAHDKELGRSVAIKELLERGNIGEVRFLREAMITARLEHPGIVPIHEAGRWPDGTPFYVMKLVAGRSLKELLDERNTVDERLELLHHVIAVADAVAYAHERGIIHRDLKPGNVIAGDFGETIVIDWGLAKDLHAAHDEPIPDGPYRVPAQTDLTAAGSVIGTPLYMSPEQARGASVDQRTDVYAIGAMLWQLCSLISVPPSDARERERLLRRSRIDRDLIAIITKSLASDAAARYRDAGELAADLKAFKSGARIAARHYSLLATFAHWIRRHRVIAATVAAAAALVVTSSVLYVRNIASERDRADEAAAHTETQRAIAASERDHARLAEASALLEKDPTRARQVLEKLTIRTPQAALLRARANQGAASQVLRVADGIARLLRHPVTSEIVVVTQMGGLNMFDVDRGELRVLDRHLHDPIAPEANGWIYLRKPFGKDARIATTTGPQTVVLGEFLAGNDGILLAAAGRRYALDRSELYTIEDSGPVLVRRGVRAIAGSERVLMVCTVKGQLEVMRDGAIERRTRCANNPSERPMAVAGTDYAALLDDKTLLLVRGGKPLELSTRLTGEYELALASSGLLGVVDFNGRPWFVAPGGDRLELGPSHAARVLSVAVDGHVAAWAFEDGAVIALDTNTGQTWHFIGHADPVFKIAIDQRRGRLLSAGREELRVWSLTPSPIELVHRLPCLAFNAVASADGTRIVLDCNDGIAREWTLATNRLRTLHRHDSLAYGVAWLGDAGCSAGWDGRVICTSAESTRELRPRGRRVRRLVASAHRHELAIATDDGAISTSTGAELFRQGSVPFMVAFSSDGTRVASGGADGSVMVYDIVERKVRSSTVGHAGLVVGVAWRDHELWTAGMDGAIRRWRDDAGQLVAVESLDMHDAVRQFRLFANGWSATVGGRVLVVHEKSGELRLELDRHIERSDVSPDGRYVAAATSREVTIVDLHGRAVATAPLATRGGYVGFARRGFLTVSNASGLVSVPLSSLQYTSFGHLPSRDQ
jgi:eukaryotic-like serine/threonine-protein kinase